jgi:hypothetical protein
VTTAINNFFCWEQGAIFFSPATGQTRVGTKWRFQFFAKYDYRFLLDVIIPIIATFFAKAIIAISRLSLSISLE